MNNTSQRIPAAQRAIPSGGVSKTPHRRAGLIVLAAVLLLVSPPPVSAAEPITITVEQAVHMAREFNRGLQRNELELATARQNIDLAFRAFYPQINATGSLTILNDEPNSIPGFPQPRNIFRSDISAALNINAAIFYSITQARLQYQQGVISLEEVAYQVESSVRQMFTALLLLEEQQRIAEEALRLEERRADQSEVRFEAGLIDEFTLLAARVAAVNRQVPVQELRSQYDRALRQFNLIIGLDINTPVELAGAVDPDIYTIDRAQVIDKLLPLSPELRRLEKSVEIFTQTRNVTATAFAPSLSVRYGLSLAYERDIFTDPGGVGDLDDWTVGDGLSVILTVPLDDFIPGSNTWVVLDADRRRIDQARLQLEERRQGLESEVVTLMDTLERIALNLESKRLNVDRATRAVQLADAGYEAGIRELLEVQDAQNQLDNARFDYLSERYTYQDAQIQLASLLGVDQQVLREYRQ